MLFVADVGIIGFLTWHAYRDGENSLQFIEGLPAHNMLADGLDRFEVPFFGGLASSFVDSE